jgi:hypothetical protein
MNFEYDHQYPDDWNAIGSLIIDNVCAESFPKGAHLKNLKGRVFFSRGKTIELTVEDLIANVNQAPIKLFGSLTGGRTPEMLIRGKAYAEDLDLDDFDSLLPHLKYLGLAGKLDLDLDFNIPLNDPKETRLDGSLNAHQIDINLHDYNTVVQSTDIEIEFGGDKVQLTKMDVNINDQFFHLEGNASSPLEPKISLRVQSPNLDVDRLLSNVKGKNKPSQQMDSDVSDTNSMEAEKNITQEPPTWVYNLTADLQVKIEKGKYRNQSFKDLNVIALYEKGALPNYGVNFHLANGRVITHGSADLRDLKRIPFVMNPNISNLQIGELTTFFEVDKMPLYGPLSINGYLEGVAGGNDDLLSSLNGALRVDVGPGRLPEIKHLGKLATKILTFINIRGLFSGALTDKMQKEGIPFKAIKSESTFGNGNMNLNNFIFISDSLNGNCQGIIDFQDDIIALQIVLQPLQTIDRILGIVPLLGRQAQKLTNIYLVVDGPLDDPNVRTELTRGVRDAIKGTLNIPGAIFRDSEDLSKEIEEYVEQEGSDQ